LFALIAIFLTAILNAMTKTRSASNTSRRAAGFWLVALAALVLVVWSWLTALLIARVLSGLGIGGGGVAGAAHRDRDAGIVQRHDRAIGRGGYRSLHIRSAGSLPPRWAPRSFARSSGC
jgi:hypothetical protein